MRAADVILGKPADAAPAFDHAHVDHAVEQVDRAPSQVEGFHAVETVHQYQPPERLELVVAHRPQEVRDLGG